MRRLLYMAAWSFAKHPKFQPLYAQMRSRGLSSTAANAAMARKLARIAFALMEKDEGRSTDLTVESAPEFHVKMDQSCRKLVACLVAVTLTSRPVHARATNMKLPVTRTPIQTRYSDTDAMGHFSSGSYITFMEIGRLDFFRKLFEQTGAAASTVVANITVDILHESRYGEELEVVTWCARVGNKSLKICNDTHANGRLVAKGSTVNVGFDPVTRQSAPLPGGWEASETP